MEIGYAPLNGISASKQDISNLGICITIVDVCVGKWTFGLVTFECYKIYKICSWTANFCS